ncbi:hypothetical protein AAZX31_17G228500 [Glycine max]
MVLGGIACVVSSFYSYRCMSEAADHVLYFKFSMVGTDLQTTTGISLI